MDWVDLTEDKKLTVWYDIQTDKRWSIIAHLSGEVVQRIEHREATPEDIQTWEEDNHADTQH